MTTGSFWVIGAPDMARHNTGAGYELNVATARAVLEAVVNPSLCGMIDLFSDIHVLPSDVEQALLLLRTFSPPPERRLFRKGLKEPTHMAVPVRFNDLAALAAFIAYAPYSIHAAVFPRGSEDDPILTLHDTSLSIHGTNETLPFVQDLSLPEGCALLVGSD